MVDDGMRQITIHYVRADCTIGRVLARAVWRDDRWHCGLGPDGWQKGLPETTWRRERDAIQCLHLLLDARPSPVPRAHRDVLYPAAADA